MRASAASLAGIAARLCTGDVATAPAMWMAIVPYTPPPALLRPEQIRANTETHRAAILDGGGQHQHRQGCDYRDG